MNCDQTFDVLTRGPFPSGDNSTDAAIESHLAACHECRQLAEALRPAVGLFHEAMDAQESLRLPGYSGELQSVEEGMLQTLTAPTASVRKQHSASTNSSSGRSVAIAWAFAAACLLGFLLGMFGERARSDSRIAMATSEFEQPANNTPNAQGQVLLASLHLPSACRVTAASGTSADTYHCCTRCHAAAAKSIGPQVRLSTLTRTCAVCHADA